MAKRGRERKDDELVQPPVKKRKHTDEECLNKLNSLLKETDSLIAGFLQQNLNNFVFCGLCKLQDLPIF